jgi:hypothetical protein
MIWLDKPPAIIIPKPPAIERAMLPGIIPVFGAAASRIITPVFVGGSFTSSANRSSVSVTTTAAIPAGSLIVVAHAMLTNNGVASSGVIDGASNVYYQLVQNQTSGTVIQTSISFAPNCIAMASAHSVTVNFTGASGGDQSGLAVAYVSGIGSQAQDVATSGSGTSVPSVTVPSGTLVSSKEIAFGICEANEYAATAYLGASAFTNLYASPTVVSQMFVFDYKQPAGTSSFNYVPTWNPAADLNACLATFQWT